ncbi:FAM18B [Mycotypha africana]|uniref:FAM18B n=1 Tax=Mycotypha africana TaxID=64632 RepID=UPI0022FFE61D|nr:FAM18B [Mycotypha africana]KAI8973213.1 FAM18B [Mycotypha africana]
MSQQNDLGFTHSSADRDVEAGGNIATQVSNSDNSNAVTGYFKQSRLGALLSYLLGSIFTDNFTLVFVVTILLLSFDFWTVKNISGRLLVGLRWWNEIQPDGTNKWVFESASPSRINNAADTRLFWWTLYGTPVLWALFAFSCIMTLKFSWLIIVAIALALNLANVYGYTQCDKDAKSKWAQNMATRTALGSLGSTATGMVGKVFTGGINRMFSSR